MDSLGLTMPIERHSILQIASIYKCNQKLLSIRKLAVQQQNGTLDCGIFAVAFAVEACEGNDISVACFDQMMMRQHMHVCLQEGVFHSFPKMKRSQKPRKVHLRSTMNLIKFELYCTCRMPEMLDDMVACDKCSMCLHCSCTDLELECSISELTGVEWWCKECRANP